MRQIVDSERAWQTTISAAREQLLKQDPRELYLDFLTDLKKTIESDSTKAPRLSRLLTQVAIRGFGMTYEQIKIHAPRRGGSSWRVEPFDIEAIREHLENHIVGKYFLNQISVDQTVWNNLIPLIGSSDVSQHCSAVPIPANFFTRRVPFVLNNAAGTLLKIQEGRSKYEALFNPRPDDELLQWMLIDPSYQEELQPEDYQRCLASAMDVGQYTFDHNFLLNPDRRPPDIVLRDGSLFPQDAYLDNFVIDNRRGKFTRKAIRELLSCLQASSASNIIYCGVAKSVQLKVYSAAIDWYISKYIDHQWEAGNYTLNDGQAMTLLLASPEFIGNNLNQTIYTCLIRRSFTTRANLNTKTNLNNLNSYFNRYESKIEIDININPFRQLCNLAHLYMFFMGHSKSPEQRLPRYDFFHHDSLGSPETVVHKILASLQYATPDVDEDHSFMSDEPVTYLVPGVTLQAHNFSKDVGECITEQTEDRIMARYRAFLSELV
ncbi:MAG: hypothetical protein AAF821_15260 [Cyanobacteria bacterium P01_D01_bin.156]